MEIQLTYSGLQFDKGEESVDTLPLIVRGMSCKAGYIANKHFLIPDTELSAIAKSLKDGIDSHGAYILKDHGFESAFTGKSVDKLVGRIIASSVTDRKVNYSGRIEDADLALKIRKKLVTASSVSLHVDEMRCSICGDPYGSPTCTHLLGKEYADEGIHEDFKRYESDFGKPIAAIVGGKITAKEQSVVLFPAIEGASVGLNFSEDGENFIADIEAKKAEPEIDYKVKFEELEPQIARLESELETAKEVIGEFHKRETARQNAYRKTLTERIEELRDARGLPERDYPDASTELLESVLEMLENIQEHSTSGVVPGEVSIPDSQFTEREDIRSKIFGYRKNPDGTRTKTRQIKVQKSKRLSQ